MKTVFFITLLTCCVFNFAIAQDGLLDPSFDLDGIVISDFTEQDELTSMAIQTDGKILAAGCTRIVSQSYLTVIRFNQNGSIDVTFGDAGIFRMGFKSEASKIEVDASNNIYVVGQNNTNDQGLLIRLLNNGTFDPSFGEGGIAFLNIDTVNGYYLDARAFRILDDGKLIVGGTYNPGFSGDREFGFMKVNENGTIDPSFGILGFCHYQIGYNDSNLNDLIIQPDQKIVAVGNAVDDYNSTKAVLRLLPDGNIDSTFSDDGYFSSLVHNNEDVLEVVQLYNDGRILAAGGNFIDGAGEDKYSLLRLLSNGEIDPSFGDINGEINIDVDQSGQVNGAILDDDENLYISGSAIHEGYDRATTIKLSFDGSFDETFGDGGFVYTQYLDTLDIFINDIKLQTDGKILVCGRLYHEASYTGDFIVLRYLNNGLTQIGNNPNQNNLSIYPNPTSDVLFINAISDKSENASIQIFDEMGELLIMKPIFKELGSNKFSIPIKVLPDGLYFLKIMSTNSILSVKFFKQG